MWRLAGLVAVTVGLAATAAGIGNGTTAEITQTGELFDDFSSARRRFCSTLGIANASSILAHTIR